MFSCMADRRSRPSWDVGTTKGADSVLMAETNWSAACGSGCEEAEGDDGDPIGAPVGVGAGGNDTLIWPHRDGLIWPRLRHAGLVVTV